MHFLYDNLDASPTFVHKLLQILQAAMCFNKGSGIKGQQSGVTVPCKIGMPREHKGSRPLANLGNRVFFAKKRTLSLTYLILFVTFRDLGNKAYLCPVIFPGICIHLHHEGQSIRHHSGNGKSR